MEWNGMNRTTGMPRKLTHLGMTAIMSVFQLCVGPILCPKASKNCQWVAMKVVCELNECILGSKSSVM